VQVLLSGILPHLQTSFLTSLPPSKPPTFHLAREFYNRYYDYHTCRSRPSGELPCLRAMELGANMPLLDHLCCSCPRPICGSCTPIWARSCAFAVRLWCFLRCCRNCGSRRWYCGLLPRTPSRRNNAGSRWPFDLVSPCRRDCEL
jgi:hypothetical protein